ncbi:MAG TPA: hypothetical protein VNU93_04995, partial [Verrucomicrobiae bacterium]|nr:hypothetical protein [Verrucomicrobiae bacterium]
MTPLWRKLGRDLKGNWAQFLAVIIVITLGGGFFIGSFSARSGVEESLAKTYGDFNFAQYWLKLEGEGPPSLPTGVEMRETAQVSLEFKEGTRAGAVAIGIPSGGPEFNKLKVLKGALPGEGQVLVEVGFAKFHSLDLGDTLTVKNGDKVYNWVVAGIAGSVEYIWPVTDRFLPNPSPRSFGVIYVPERQLIRDITGLNHEL